MYTLEQVISIVLLIAAIVLISALYLGFAWGARSQARADDTIIGGLQDAIDEVLMPLPMGELYDQDQDTAWIKPVQPTGQVIRLIKEH